VPFIPIQLGKESRGGGGKKEKGGGKWEKRHDFVLALRDCSRGKKKKESELERQWPEAGGREKKEKSQTIIEYLSAAKSPHKKGGRKKKKRGESSHHGLHRRRRCARGEKREGGKRGAKEHLRILGKKKGEGQRIYSPPHHSVKAQRVGGVSDLRCLR